MNLSTKEQNIILATIHHWNINKKNGFVPDYELMENPFNLSKETMREIRDLVQTIKKRFKK